MPPAPAVSVPLAPPSFSPVALLLPPEPGSVVSTLLAVTLGMATGALAVELGVTVAGTPVEFAAPMADALDGEEPLPGTDDGDAAADGSGVIAVSPLGVVTPEESFDVGSLPHP
jgi:hypothetical protein